MNTNTNQRKERIVNFLREKGILSSEGTEWFLKFVDKEREVEGELNINELFDEFAHKEIVRLEGLDGEDQIDSLINKHTQLMVLGSGEVECIKEVVVSYARILRAKIERLQSEVDSYKNDLEIHW